MSKRKLTKSLIALAGVTAITMALAGCSSDEEGTGESTGPVNLSYAIWDVNQQPAMQEIADKFNEENPNVTVEIQATAYEDYFTKLQTSISGGAGPDVFWMNGPNFQLYASNEMLAPLDDEDLDTSNYPDSLIDLYSYDGSIYGAPKDFDTIAVWYNKDLFDQAGVEYPAEGWTWADMQSAAEQISALGDNTYGIAASHYGQTDYYNTIYQAGGYVINEDRTETGYGSPEALEGVEFWTDFIANGSSPTEEQMTDTEPNDMFMSGTLGMFTFGSWAAVQYADTDIADQIAVAPLPMGPTGNQSVVHGIGNVANANSENLAWAKKFAAFASGEEAATIQADSGTVIPAFNGMQQAWIDSTPQYDLQVFIDALETGVAYPVSENTAAWNALESEILTQVWAGNTEPAAGLQDLATQMQAELDSESE